MNKIIIFPRRQFLLRGDTTRRNRRGVTQSWLLTTISPTVATVSLRSTTNPINRAIPAVRVSDQPLPPTVPSDQKMTKSSKFIHLIHLLFLRHQLTPQNALWSPFLTHSLTTNWLFQWTTPKWMITRGDLSPRSLINHWSRRPDLLRIASFSCVAVSSGKQIFLKQIRCSFPIDQSALLRFSTFPFLFLNSPTAAAEPTQSIYSFHLVCSTSCQQIEEENSWNTFSSSFNSKLSS